MPAILTPERFVEILYLMVKQNNLREASDLLKKYIDSLELHPDDELDFELYAAINVISLFTKDCKDYPVYFIRQSDYEKTLLPFLLTYGDVKTKKMKDTTTSIYKVIDSISACDLIIKNDLSSLNTMNKDDAVYVILKAIDLLLDFEDNGLRGDILGFFSTVPFDGTNFSIFTDNQTSVRIFKYTNFYNIIRSFLGHVIDENFYAYIIVDDTQFGNLELEYMSLSYKSDIETYIQQVKSTLANAFVDIIRSNYELIPSYYSEDSYLSEISYALNTQRGYKIYFEDDFTELLEDYEHIKDEVLLDIEDYLFQNDEMFYAYSEYLAIKYNGDPDEDGQLERILEKYPELENYTEDEIIKELNSIVEYVYDETIRYNRDYIIDELARKGLIEYVEFDNTKFADYIYDALMDTDIYDYRHVINYIEEFLDIEFSEKDLLTLLIIVDNDFDEDLKLYHDPNVPVYVFQQ